MQLEDFKSGRKVFGESELAKKEREKDTMIQDKQKLEDELQKHKIAISIVLEKTGIVASQLPPGSSLDERTMAYFQSVSSLEAAKISFLNDVEGPQCSPAVASTLDTSATSTGQKVLTQQTKLPRPKATFTEEREKEKASSVGKPNVEARKPGRKFMRPSLEKPEGPTTDTEVSGVEVSSTAEGKAHSSVENEVIEDFSIAQPTLARKRLTPSEPEIPEGSVAQDEINIAARPKRTKESDFSDISEVYDIPQSSENPDTTLQGLPLSDVSEMQMSETKDELELDNFLSASNVGNLNMGKEDEDNILVNEESEEQQNEYLDVANPEEVQYEGNIIIEQLSDKPSAPIEILDEGPKNEEKKDTLFSATEGEGDKEEGSQMSLNNYKMTFYLRKASMVSVLGKQLEVVMKPSIGEAVGSGD